MADICGTQLREHGTNARYVSGCHCAKCRAAAALRSRIWLRKRAELGPLKVSPDESLEHLDKLREAGYSWNAIADECGIGASYLRRLKERQTILYTTAEKIMCVPMHFAPKTGMVPIADGKKLVDAMSAAGISQRTVARKMRMADDCVVSCVQGRRMWATNYRKILVIYKHLARQGKVPASLLEEVGV